MGALGKVMDAGFGGEWAEGTVVDRELDQPTVVHPVVDPSLAVDLE
jgi:hypothetical protein